MYNKKIYIQSNILIKLIKMKKRILNNKKNYKKN